ncbi:hypothetical protein H6G41_30485 [Tolypothrix sp. FACHB-123]|uniref:hypothetical protein n=1 Tax=Tolypothrix sp. FACHB-123 TaxID=2692868 RepID=UPI0016894BE5|nr:hypothetical protein [Tolypothrix sp. FACHB-123]MBD2358876.1 hypothetical protein [Tolypothrix sp. FACHB-123]
MKLQQTDLMRKNTHKITTYVSRAEHERFKEFQKERGLSRSKAMREILNEHLPNALAKNFTSELTSKGSLPSMKTDQNLDTETEKLYSYQLSVFDLLPGVLTSVEDRSQISDDRNKS